MNLMSAPPRWLPTALLCVMILPLLLVVFAALWFLALCSDLSTRLRDEARKADHLWP
jgi:hypothetical protein